MATHFTLPRQQVVDIIGRPVSGAKAYFYTPGTTTAKDVFSDAPLTTPHAFPVVADSYGRFPVIYYGSGQYKVVLTDADDVTIYTADNIDPSIATGLAALPIAQGGTGATSAATALTALGAAAEDDLTLISTELSEFISSSLMIGEVRTIAFQTPPPKWFECDGDAISRTTYSALFSAIGTSYGVGDGSTTFNIPDMRGEFARGWDNGRGIDTGRVWGSSQSGQIVDHTHIVRQNNAIGAGGGGAFAPLVNSGGTADGVSLGVSTGSGAETRPRNIVFKYIIYTGVS